MSERTQIRESRVSEAVGLFDARSVVVVGASDDPGKISGRPLHFFKALNFPGPVYAVNPRRDMVQGETTYKTVSDIPGPVDLAVIAVAARDVKSAIIDCAESGVRVAVVFAGGFGETGESGRALQGEIKAIARQAGMRVIGPNTLGMVDFGKKISATFSPAVLDIKDTPEKGLGVVTQSGALGNYLLTQSIEMGLPINKWVATGNECDVEFAEVLHAMASDPNVTGIIAYLEGARDSKALKAGLETARRNRVPVALLKVGATDVGARAVVSHTDAIVGDDRIYDALFRQYGVVRVHTVEDLLDLGRTMASRVRVKGRKTLLITISGGVGIIMAEAASQAKLDLPNLSDQVKAALRERVPFLSPNNPLDVTGQVAQDFGLLGQALDLGVADTEADIVVTFIGRVARNPESVDEYFETLAEKKRQFPNTLFITVGMFDPVSERKFRDQGNLIFTDPSRAIYSAHALANFNDAFVKASPANIDVSSFRRPPLSASPNEEECYRLLAGIGVDVPDYRVIGSEEEVSRACEALSFPAVMKILSRNIVHKSDVGGVRLNIENANQAKKAFSEIIQAVEVASPKSGASQALIMPMEADFAEIIIAAKVDPQLGPILMIGLGGVFVEVLGDVSVRPAPVTMPEVLEMLQELKGARLFQAFRGKQARDLKAVAETAAKLSCFIAANSDWARAIEINPFAAGPVGNGGRAIDCVINLFEGGQ